MQMKTYKLFATLSTMIPSTETNIRQRFTQDMIAIEGAHEINWNDSYAFY